MTSRFKDVAEISLFNADGTPNAAARNNPILMQRAALIESMFYAGEVPWHGRGVGVEDAQTSEEAIRLAGLDWEVALGEVLAGPNRELLDRKAVYRATDGKVLGITGGKDRYQPIQNREMFTFMDSLIADRTMRYEAAGSLLGGKRVWIVARLDEDIEIAGDVHFPYLLLVAGHDLESSLKIFPTLVRPICMNTIQRALDERDVAKTVRIVHTGKMQDKLAAAQDVLRLTTQQMRRYQEYLSKLAEVEVTKDQIETVKSGFFTVEIGGKVSTQKTNMMQQFDAIYNAEKALHGDTAYTLVQTLTGYSDHSTRVRDNADGKLFSSVYGSIAGTKKRGLDVLSMVLKDAGVAVNSPV